MSMKKSKLLAAMSEHRYRAAREIARRAGMSPGSAATQLSRLYRRGEVDRDTSSPFRYILRKHELPLCESLEKGEINVLTALASRDLGVHDHVDRCRSLGKYLSELTHKGAAFRVSRGVYRITVEGRAFIESLDKPTPKQQPLPEPTPAPTPTPKQTPTPTPTPEPEREPVPWPMPAHPPTVVERPQYTSAALIVAAAAIIIAIIVTGCIQ